LGSQERGSAIPARAGETSRARPDSKHLLPSVPVSALPKQLTEALRDRHVIERELGRGGMATVYLARDLRHYPLLAHKVLHAASISLSAILILNNCNLQKGAGCVCGRPRYVL
jgi:serine/threonine protein kinase